jgi:hypothetical protein
MSILRSIATTIACTFVLFALANPTATAQEDVLRSLERQGAQIVPMSKMPQGMSSKPRKEHYDCDGKACWCVGGADCLKLIDEQGGNCQHFVCGNDHGTVVCWCDL